MIATDYKSAYEYLAAVVNNRPSIIRNTVWVWTLRVAMWICALFFFVTSFLLTFGVAAGARMLELNTIFILTVEEVDQEAALQVLALVLGGISMMLSLQCILMAYLCRIILRRNRYMKRVDHALTDLDAQLRAAGSSGE